MNCDEKVTEIRTFSCVLVDSGLFIQNCLEFIRKKTQLQNSHIHEQPMQWHLCNDHKAMPPPKADKMPKLTISLHLVNAKMRHVGIKIGKTSARLSTFSTLFTCWFSPSSRFHPKLQTCVPRLPFCPPHPYATVTELLIIRR